MSKHLLAEISYDLVMDEEMAFVEGTFRLPSQDWQVFIFSGFRKSIPKPQVEFTSWQSGVTGVYVSLPVGLQLNRAEVERILSAALDVEKWRVVQGPDSLQLR